MAERQLAARSDEEAATRESQMYAEHLDQILRRLGSDYDASAVPTFAFDRDRRRIYTNAAFDELVGHDGQAFLGKPPPYPYWASPHEMGEQIKAAVAGVFAKLGVQAIRTEYIHSSGRRFHVLITGSELRIDAAAQPVAYLGFATDLTGVTQDTASFTVAAQARIRLLEDTLNQVAAMLARSGILGFTHLVTLPRMRGAADSDGRAAPASPAGSESGVALAEHVGPPLTARERELAGMLAAGRRTAEIARALAISPHTVRNHAKSIYQKLGVHSQVELIAKLSRL